MNSAKAGPLVRLWREHWGNDQSRRTTGGDDGDRGAGISGLAVAHLLHRQHEMTVLANTRADTRTRSGSTPLTKRITSTRASSCSTTATTPSFDRLCPTHGRGVAAVNDDVQRSDGSATSSTTGFAERAVRQTGACRNALVHPDDRRHGALQPCRAGAAPQLPATAHRWVTGLSSGFSRPSSNA